MKCQYCGQEVPNGELFCSCGHPVGYGTGQSSPVTLSAMPAKKRSNKKSLAVVLVIILLAVLYYFFKSYFAFTVPAFYRTVSTSEFSMKIPVMLQQSNDIEEDGQIAFYTSEKAAVDIVKDTAYVNIDLSEFGEYAVKSGIVDDYTYEDGVLYFTFNDSASTSLGGSANCYVVEALYKGDDAFYSVKAYCKIEDKDKFEDYLIKWVKSFKIK